MNGDSFIPLAITDRSGCEESLHHGALVLIDADGSTMLALGDPEVEIFPRSSLKPLQAWSMVRNGLDLPDDLLALVCASHDGRQMHIEGVRRILDSAGLTEESLSNTPDLPLASDEAERVLARGGRRSSIQQNCSGKHAGMLATCVAAHWPADSTYLDMDHPLQVAITRGIAMLAGREVSHIGVDGCGAPSHVMHLIDLARAFRAIATGSAGPEAERIHRAMRAHPDMVGGVRHPTTEMMRGIPGLMLKDGAEGVFAGASSDGRAVALKIADGANRARLPIMRVALRALGFDISSIEPWAFESPVLGHGDRVGEVRCVKEVADIEKGV